MGGRLDCCVLTAPSFCCTFFFFFFSFFIKSHYSSNCYHSPPTYLFITFYVLKLRFKFDGFSIFLFLFFLFIDISSLILYALEKFSIPTLEFHATSIIIIIFFNNKQSRYSHRIILMVINKII